jgi:hypothetical protein
MHFDAGVRREADVANRNGRADASTRAVVRAGALQRAITLLDVARLIRANHVLHRGMVVLLGHCGHPSVIRVRVRVTAAETLRRRRGSRILQRDHEQKTDQSAIPVHAASVVPAVTIFNTCSCGS